MGGEKTSKYANPKHLKKHEKNLARKQAKLARKKKGSKSREKSRKLVVGYILRVHPAWEKFVDLARGLGKPLVMRMNLNQQSSGDQWYTHKQLMNSMSPIVDCGVHYVDIMCLMTRSIPVSVSAIGARLSEEIDKEMYNYGQLQVRFEDGSVGWYEAAWGPMISETSFFIKDVMGPGGCVSITDKFLSVIRRKEIQMMLKVILKQGGYYCTTGLLMKMDRS